MRSYYAHLENASVSKTVPNKPTFRSSALFPMINFPGIHSRVLFMGYWILKRNIKEITCVITLREEVGNVLNREIVNIHEPKAYRIELEELLAKSGISPQTSFIGSLEVEFFSTQNLFFPYPAAVVNYYGEKFSTVVHTAQRVYNDYEDMIRNSQTDVAESGFNIYANETQEPLLGIINGPEEQTDQFIELQIFNSKKEKLQHKFSLGNLHPYETKILYPGREIDLKNFLQGEVGVVKANFHLDWVFPRLLVGNIDHDMPSLSITHSYYDCTEAKADSDYWRPSEPLWHPASLMVPVTLYDCHFTNVYFYPIYSPSHLQIDIELYDCKGKLVGRKQNALKVISPGKEFRSINLKEIVRELNIPDNQMLGARLICQPIEQSRMPTRVKIGLDLGKQNKMPCNICTNLHPFNPGLESKPISFRWAPVLADQKNASVWLMNSSPYINYQKSAELELTFYREKDPQTLQRKITIPPNGFEILKLPEDKELADFFEGHIGWMTAVTSNSYTTTYYFTESTVDLVGGDHGF